MNQFSFCYSLEILLLYGGILSKNKKQEVGAALTHLTLGYGYCFPFGYRPPVNRGITMFGTRESFMVRNASLSPSGDHQWAI